MLSGIPHPKNWAGIQQMCKSCNIEFESTNSIHRVKENNYDILYCMSDFIDPIIYTDSAVVANHINGTWKCKNEALLPLLMTIQDIREEYKFRVLQVQRNFVWEPDALANEFLNQLEARKLIQEK